MKFFFALNWARQFKIPEHISDDFYHRVFGGKPEKQKAPHVESDLLDALRELNLERGASPDEIKRAYRKLMMIHHPDRGENNSPQKAQKINKAYGLLKERYDIK